MGNDRYQILIVSASAAADEMRLRLAESGFTAVKNVTYPNVIENIRQSLPDLILLTQQPGMSSLLILSKISRQFPMVPIVIVATDINAEVVQEHLDAGACDYIYYVSAEKELLAFVVQQNLEHRLKVLAIEAQEETVTMFEQLERDQQSGFRVQQAMLPKSPMSIRGLTFDHQLYPSMIMSGDFIDYFELFDGRVAFYIADVSGHGASSAFITVLLKSMSRRLLDEYHDLKTTAEILTWFNSELMHWNLEHHVAMFFGIIDQENSLLEYSNAAHFPGTILCHENDANFPKIGGQPLGLFSEPSYESHEVHLPDLYSIVMFSDGVFEILPQQTLEDKEAHLLSLVKSHRQEDLDALVDDLGVLTARRIPDDIAVFTVESSG
ncbi:MAG: fused response regulator/phosphatase [Gammaproteobacteria bacterium]|nr:fused response regulator/phosphatase [Gammaproteobacteria bacterium]